MEGVKRPGETDPKYCGPCTFYSSFYGCCSYWDSDQHSLRPCPPGKGCTVRVSRSGKPLPPDAGRVPAEPEPGVPKLILRRADAAGHNCTAGYAWSKILAMDCPSVVVLDPEGMYKDALSMQASLINYLRRRLAKKGQWSVSLRLGGCRVTKISAEPLGK